MNLSKSMGDKDALRSSAAATIPLIEEIKLHLRDLSGVESCMVGLENLQNESDNRSVVSKSKDAKPLVSALLKEIEVRLEREEWGRDNV